MGCRCADIAMYENDIKTLESAISEAQNLISHADSVHEGIANLGTIYPYTLNTRDEFYTKLSLLDDGAQDNAAKIKSKLEDAKTTVDGWLKDARDEDNAYDHDGN